jgi:ADP-ribose pyrophosphatase YjhB (NUDIX family)
MIVKTNNYYVHIGSRAGAIVCHNNNILVIYRKKSHKEYYTFPGGTVEDNETIGEAVIRELQEETSITATLTQSVYHLEINNIMQDNGLLGVKHEYLVVCNYVSGEPVLHHNAVERQRQSNSNVYRPMWIPIHDIKNTLLYPLELRDVLLKDVDTSFKDNMTSVRIAHQDMRHN